MHCLTLNSKCQVVPKVRENGSWRALIICILAFSRHNFENPRVEIQEKPIIMPQCRSLQVETNAVAARAVTDTDRQTHKASTVTLAAHARRGLIILSLPVGRCSYPEDYSYPNGQCVSSYSTCDGYNDCEDGSDEEYCCK